jgi:hypothetical protein
MNTNVWRNHLLWKQNVFHALKYELKKESVLDVQQTFFTTVYGMEHYVDTECIIMGEEKKNSVACSLQANYTDEDLQLYPYIYSKNKRFEELL